MKEITPESQGPDKISRTPQAKKQGRITGLPGEFSKMLSEQLEGKGPGPETPANGLPELEPAYSPGLARFNQTQIPGQISEAIDLLEKYALGLEDPDITLRQAWDLLDQVGTRTRDISEEMAQTRNDDPRLKEIMTHLSTLVELEKIKINRGDYS